MVLEPFLSFRIKFLIQFFFHFELRSSWFELLFLQFDIRLSRIDLRLFDFELYLLIFHLLSWFFFANSSSVYQWRIWTLTEIRMIILTILLVRSFLFDVSVRSTHRRWRFRFVVSLISWKSWKQQTAPEAALNLNTWQ